MTPSHTGPGDRRENVIVDAAQGLDVKSVRRFPWGRAQALHDGQFSIRPPTMDCRPRLLIYVHGYNEDIEVATAYGNGSIAKGWGAREESGQVATFLWNSKFGALSFGKAVDAANATAPVFAAAVQQLQLACPGMRVHVIAHSLGARVVLKAVEESEIGIRDLVLIAPAVDCDALESGGEFANVSGRVERLLFTHNKADKTMRWYRLRGHRALGERGFKHPCRMPSNTYALDMVTGWRDHGRDGGHGAILHPAFWSAFWDEALPKGFFQ